MGRLVIIQLSLGEAHRLRLVRYINVDIAPQTHFRCSVGWHFASAHRTRQAWVHYRRTFQAIRGREAHRNDVWGDVGQIQVKPILLEPPLVL